MLLSNHFTTSFPVLTAQHGTSDCVFGAELVSGRLALPRLSIVVLVQRVVVIVAAVLFFKNPVTTQSMAYTGLALFGVFTYSQAKRIFGSIKMQKGNLTHPTEASAVYPPGSDKMMK
jgi:hypothetical protein